MTGKEFVAWAEAVYGEYRAAMKAEVILFLDEYNEWWVDNLKKTVLLEYESFNKPPGVHELHAMEKRVKEYQEKVDRDQKALERYGAR